MREFQLDALLMFIELGPTVQFVISLGNICFLHGHSITISLPGNLSTVVLLSAALVDV